MLNAINALGFEYWVNIFAFVSRQQLAQKVPSIGCYLFAFLAQSFLHEFGKITLGHLRLKIVKENGKTKAILQRRNGHVWSAPLQIACVPIPKNVKSFESLEIISLVDDKTAMQFLRHFQQHGLFKDAYLHIDISGFCHSNIHLMLPMISNLQALQIDSKLFFELMGTKSAKLQNRNHVVSLLSNVKLLQLDFSGTKSLAEHKLQILLAWLYQNSVDGSQKMLLLDEWTSEDVWTEMVEGIQETLSKSRMSANFTVINRFHQITVYKKCLEVKDSGIFKWQFQDNQRRIELF